MQMRIAVAFLAAACLGGGAEAQSGRRAPADAGPNEQARAQLASVRSALKLTPEQVPNWQLYESKVVVLIDDLGHGFSPPTGATAIRQIDARVDVVRNRLTAMEDIADAAARLYGGLTEEQKGTADKLLAGTLPGFYPGVRMKAQPRRGDARPQK